MRFGRRSFRTIRRAIFEHGNDQSNFQHEQSDPDHTT